MAEHYVHAVDGNPQSPHGQFIVTMNSELAKLIHTVHFTLHDATYKRVKESIWKEWEIVVWCSYLNERKSSCASSLH
jgi:hypothetical protein